ncbi:Triacylglycerol lipase 2-like [Heracleum sosnowskyi]|uniref:Triacylglycerol lipase 2-like n=1 Tax=Heracleum sosnowskyi TaxID=360622 RepID=A0AAD8JH01_9APIA|nr:Triacylglycerol lipase 2-like [Heracleum sosnowskyi]
MGSCLSSHKDTVESDDAKFRNSFRSKSDNKFVVYSPIKENKPSGELGLKLQPDPSHNFPDFGSKEETFFDSQAWLDSDCDDDFMSVNGEFTPSRGNTPLHHSFATGSQQVHKVSLVEEPAPGVKPEQVSPTDKKMRLSELFKQSIRVKQDADDEKNASSNLSDTNCAPSLQSNGTVKAHQEKSLKSHQCCLPNLIASNNFTENKKMRALSTPVVK